MTYILFNDPMKIKPPKQMNCAQRLMKSAHSFKVPQR